MRSLFGTGIQSFTTTRHEYVETASSPREYYELFRDTCGPMVAISASLSGERRVELEVAFLQFVERSNRGTSHGPVKIPYEY